MMGVLIVGEHIGNLISNIGFELGRRGACLAVVHTGDGSRGLSRQSRLPNGNEQTRPRQFGDWQVPRCYNGDQKPVDGRQTLQECGFGCKRRDY